MAKWGQTPTFSLAEWRIFESLKMMCMLTILIRILAVILVFYDTLQVDNYVFISSNAFSDYLLQNFMLMCKMK